MGISNSRVCKTLEIYDNLLSDNISHKRLSCSSSSSSYSTTTAYARLQMKQHILFLSVCLSLHPKANVKELSVLNPYGGMIGIGNSTWLNWCLCRFKLFRLHAGFHDAYGFMKAQYNIGPGYCYALELTNRYLIPTAFARSLNYCLLGHLSGLSYWLRIKIFFPNVYELFSV